MTVAPPLRVLLVGFMGAGKTSVGSTLARRLGWRFADFDAAIEAETAQTVPDLFRDGGEPLFREVEARVATQLLGEDSIVLASGGGWAAAEGSLESVPEGTFSIWLRVTPARALERVAAQPGNRPLLQREDAGEESIRLLERRERRYALADVGVDTDGSTVEDVTARILEILATQGIETNAE